MSQLNLSDSIIYTHNVEEAPYHIFKSYVAVQPGLTGELLEVAADAMWQHCATLVRDVE